MEVPFSTPANTTGIGNPSLPDGNNPGSGDIFVSAKKSNKNKKKMKSLKNYLKKK